jgi:hypothetical protein
MVPEKVTNEIQPELMSFVTKICQFVKTIELGSVLL